MSVTIVRVHRSRDAVKIEMSSGGGDSGSKKYKRGYAGGFGGAYGGVCGVYVWWECGVMWSDVRW
jgi:hypothetical protein